MLRQHSRKCLANGTKCREKEIVANIYRLQEMMKAKHGNKLTFLVTTRTKIANLVGRWLVGISLARVCMVWEQLEVWS
jgi:hypothetical protein